MGLAAVFLTNTYFQKQKQGLRVKAAQVVVAARDISEGAVINYDTLAFKSVPLKFIQPGALNSKEAAVGKTAIAAIMAGQQVLSTNLSTPGRGLTLAGKTPTGKRAFTVSTDAVSAAGGMIRPGDHVDVLAIFTKPAIIVTLFQDILILAVGQEMIHTEEGRLRRVQETAAPTRRETVTLALTPQEVQIITVAIEQGKIRLTLRPRREVGKALPTVDLRNLPPTIDLNTLLQFYIRLPKPPPSVEVIRGLEKELTPLPGKKK
jgi:pilus assembly protein CpaB